MRRSSEGPETEPRIAYCTPAAAALYQTSRPSGRQARPRIASHALEIVRFGTQDLGHDAFPDNDAKLTGPILSITSTGPYSAPRLKSTCQKADSLHERFAIPTPCQSSSPSNSWRNRLRTRDLATYTLPTLMPSFSATSAAGRSSRSQRHGFGRCGRGVSLGRTASCASASSCRRWGSNPHEVALTAF